MDGVVLVAEIYLVVIGNRGKGKVVSWCKTIIQSSPVGVVVITQS